MGERWVSMESLKRWLVVAMAGSLLLLSATAAFAEEVVNRRFPVSFTVANPCNDEVVTMSGEFHEVVTVTSNRDRKSVV